MEAHNLSSRWTTRNGLRLTFLREEKRKQHSDKNDPVDREKLTIKEKNGKPLDGHFFKWLK